MGTGAVHDFACSLFPAKSRGFPSELPWLPAALGTSPGTPWRELVLNVRGKAALAMGVKVSVAVGWQLPGSAVAPRRRWQQHPPADAKHQALPTLLSPTWQRLRHGWHQPGLPQGSPGKGAKAARSPPETGQTQPACCLPQLRFLADLSVQSDFLSPFIFPPAAKPGLSLWQPAGPRRSGRLCSRQRGATGAPAKGQGRARP